MPIRNKRRALTLFLLKGSKSAIEPGPPCKPQRPAVFALAQTGQIVSRRRIAQKHWSGRAA
jgi:hypothetical protein